MPWTWQGTYTGIPSDRERFQAIIEEAGQVKDFEVVFKKKTGEQVDILLSARRYQERTGRDRRDIKAS